jgi:hypothetical protein
MAAGTGRGRLPWSIARVAKPWASAPARESAFACACACGGCVPALAAADAPPAERVLRHSPRCPHACHGRQMRGIASARGIRLPMRSGAEDNGDMRGQAGEREGTHRSAHMRARARTHTNAHEHKQGTDICVGWTLLMRITHRVAPRRTGAHGLRVNAALADFIVEEEASHADCEPKAPGRQSTDSDFAAVRPRRRGRRLLAVGWS